MKRICITCLLLFTAIAGFSQKNWIKQKITSRLTVSFPAAPTKTASTTFALKDTTNTIFTTTYSFIAQNLKIDEKAFAKLVITPEFSEDFLNSLQATLPGYNLSAIDVKQSKNHVSYFTEGKNEEEHKSIFMHILFVDGIYYSLSCIVPDGASTQNKNYFLSSFQVTK